jgi:AbrB family looped-hinge helix DNA binding protein
MPSRRKNKAVFVPFLTGKSKVSSKGWVAIPKDIRDELGIKPGDELSFALQGPLPGMKQDKRLSSISIIKLPNGRAEMAELFTGILPRKHGTPSSTDALLEEHRREILDDERRSRASKRPPRRSA